MSDSTVLAITGITIPDYAVRGLKMDLRPFSADSGLRRSISGELLDMTAPQFRKYSATISCEDQDVPELTDVWQGKIVTVTCIPGLGPVSDVTAGTLTLSMMVESWSTSRAEWDALTNWTINLLEI